MALTLLKKSNLLLAATAVFCMISLGAAAQSETPVLLATAELPEAPSAVAMSMEAQQQNRASQPPPLPPEKAPVAPRLAPKYAKYIPADETAQPMHGRAKIAMGFRDLYSPLTFAGIVASAGYEQAVNGAPNYGTDRGAFGQRLGAAALRSTAQGLLSDAVFAPLFHMDPRYYISGPGTGFKHRTLHAVGHLFVSKTDNGDKTINFPLLLGYVEAASLNNFYYPRTNRNFKDFATGYGGSLGGAALGFLVAEFSGSVLKALHLQH